MPIEKTTTPSLRVAETPILWQGLARAHVEAMASGAAPRRAHVTGPAGSGKSRLLRHLARTLVEAGATVAWHRGQHDIAALARTDVLLVDDAHTLDGRQLSAVADRAADYDAALILATRPWPHSDILQETVDQLERSQPAVVLGHVAHSDLRAHLESLGLSVSPDCVDGILSATGGAAWLVSESLAVHDPSLCAHDRGHDALHESLRDVIAHRLRALDPAVRGVVEEASLSVDGRPASGDRSSLVLSAYAEGMLLPNGRPVPVVRAAVQAVVPVDRLIDHYDSTVQDAGSLPLVLDGVRDPRLADALLRHADSLLADDPRRAEQLYLGAQDAGADTTVVAIRRAQIEWTLGNVDAASAHLDAVAVEADHPAHDAAADTGAAIWSARGLSTMSDLVYRTFPPSDTVSAVRSSIAALAVADADRLAVAVAAPPGRTMPSTLTVAMELLDRGMRESLAGSAEGSLNDLVRAAEMYSASGTSDPTPELPAVLAALAALHLGEAEVAHSVLDRAVSDGHGGAWAQDRLVLWRAWVALQLEHPQEVETAIESIAPRARALHPRERLLFDAVSIAIARRYQDAPALAVAWRGARESLLRARFDLFGLLPLGEFVVTAARVGESDRMKPHFAQALESIERLGSPPLWSAHVHWTGIQQAILLGRPQDLTPHARALVEAAPHNRLAATMAHAGRVWTSVLTGTVDADAVESAALGLGTVGLAWDGARLAGHGAGHTRDRKIASRLLATARRLHPHEDLRPAAVETETAPASRPRSHDDLSPREMDVAALVVQGKTYAEIGAAIFISPRTAEHHIARIRRRLGATTRSDLIAKLRVALDEAAEPSAQERDAARASA